jgi:hypothetical protein
VPAEVPTETVPHLEPIEGLPAPPPHPGDKGPPIFTDGTTAGWEARLRQGVWLLVFAPTTGDRASTTVRAVDELHRRLRPTGVEVILVASRNEFADESERLLEPDAIVARLRALGATSDLPTLLDPEVGGPYRTAVRASLRAKRDLVALLLAHGREQGRTTPPDGVFTVSTLADLAKRAIELGPTSR